MQIQRQNIHLIVKHQSRARTARSSMQTFRNKKELKD
jgi:hypothetical protein